MTTGVIEKSYLISCTGKKYFGVKEIKNWSKIIKTSKITE